MTGLIRVNGETLPVGEVTVGEATVAALLASRGIGPDARGVAVAVNGCVVPRGRWDRAPLAAGDTVEIVRAFQGG